MMKIVEEIQEDIEQYMRTQIINNIKVPDTDNYLCHLKTLKYYLETEPAKHFVVKQLRLVKNKMHRIDNTDNFYDWRSSNFNRIKFLNLPETERLYHKEMGYNKLLHQRNSIMYILGFAELCVNE